MALHPAPLLIAAPGPSLRVVGGRKHDRRTELDDLRMEVHAAGSEMKATATRISNALTAGDMHSAMHYASRLWTLGNSYTDPEGDAA
jgi:hypothetical protein